MQSGRFSIYFLVIVFACLFSFGDLKRNTSLYDPAKSNTLLLNRDNFDKQITKHRAKTVAIIHFYKHDDSGSQDLSYEFEKFASEWQGAFRIATVDCFDQYELCEKEKVQNLPTVRVYPILPVPPFDYEGDMSSKGWTGAAARFVQSNILELNGTNINKFVSENPSVPKCLLFTDKPGLPLILKALSVSFEKKIFFGIVRQEQTEIFEKYGVKRTPKILLIKPDKKIAPYEGDLKYGKIFDFLNVFTETFVPGGENLDFEKPWNREVFPELHIKSGNDICFDHDGVLCGILLSKAAPEPATVQVIEQLLKDPTENKYKYMWLNVDAQNNFAKAFAVEEYPQLVILSHGKRKKYLIHEGEFTKDSIGQTLEKIINGDARFKLIPGDLPSLN